MLPCGCSRVATVRLRQSFDMGCSPKVCVGGGIPHSAFRILHLCGLRLLPLPANLLSATPFRPQVLRKNFTFRILRLWHSAFRILHSAFVSGVFAPLPRLPPSLGFA